MGLDPQYAVKIETLKQVRPLVDGQPWGIFYLEFEAKRLPVVVLRRILHAFISCNRTRCADQPVWQMEDLLFISTFGAASPGAAARDQREIALAHFHQESAALPTLRVLGWDGADTPLKLDHVAATLKAQLCWPADPDDADTWREQWTRAFRHRLGHVIRTADALADRLALLARGIRDAATTLMAHETEHGPLRRLHKTFQTALIHDLSEADFADTYAQTITYGLLTAAISRTDMDGGRYGTVLLAQDVANLVPVTNPFLREMLQTFLRAGGGQSDLPGEGGIDFDELGVQDVVDLLRGDETDLPAILRDFGNRTHGEDPVIHFYEHFLAAYDKQLKVKRGIFYTPQPAVSYIVRSVHELLQTEFGLEDGLASTVTWGEMAERLNHRDTEDTEKDHKKTPWSPCLRGEIPPETPFVQILDPATGTATFLVEVIEVIFQTLKARWTAQGLTEAQRRAAWNAYVPRHLLPRLYGYELMMAPYAIAHMKIGLKLHETGYRFCSDARVRIYLTNALEPASDDEKQLAFAELVPALAHEARAVNEIKRRVPATVVIGNPPYSGHSANDSVWIAGLLRGVDGAGRTVENYFEVDGHGLNERNPKWLNDDYVKFIRFGQWRIAETGVGMLAFITNHGYLDNPTFRGMRQSLMANFDRIYVLDLHGSSKKKETTPEGGPDENVFDIMQGVAIGLFVKEPGKSSPTVYHADLWGSRENKYQSLLNMDVGIARGELLKPQKPFYLFTPQDLDLLAEYQNGWRVTDILPNNSVGVVTGRDSFAFAFDKQALQKRIEDFLDLNQSEETVRQKYLRPNDSLDIVNTRTELAQEEFAECLVQCQYRPFDTRWLFYHDAVIERSRSQVIPHLIRGANLGLISARSNKADDMNHFFITSHPMETKCGESTTQSYVFPLYLYPVETDAVSLFDAVSLSHWPPDSEHGNRMPNLSPEFVHAVEEKLGLTFTPIQPTPHNSQPATFGPKDIFHYAYAIFHSPTYRTRYAEFLKIDFPRLPLTSDVGLFRALAQLGADLVALHLLEDDYAAASWNRYTVTAGLGDHKGSPLRRPITTFVEGDNGTTMGAFSKSACYLDGRVYLDTSNRARSSYFDGVPEDVWNFHIGGYQVLYKWLYDRRGSKGQPGRTLTAEDIEHYQRIVVALKETMRLMAEIDAVIDGHSGWPIG